MTQCTAKSKRTGERCKRPAIVGRTVCYHHGGKIPRGPALPQYKDGRYSKLLPARLAANYERAASDADLLVLREDIALVDTRLADLLGRVDSGESGEAWRKARDAFNMLKDGLAQSDTVAAKAGMTKLDEIITRGRSDHFAWREIGDLLDRRERLVRSERRRMVELQQMITNEQALTMMSAIVALVKEHVDDKHALAAISDGIRRLAMVDGGTTSA